MSFRALIVALVTALLSNNAISFDPNVVVAANRTGDAFVIEAKIETSVSLATVWDVLVDFDHMTSILSNLTLSKVLRRNGNALLVRQEGVAQYGPFSYSFESEREIQLDPMKQILAKSVSGTASRMESETKISQSDDRKGITVRYRAEITPDSALARMFGLSFVQHEVEEQFRLMVAEMDRRDGRSR